MDSARLKTNINTIVYENDLPKICNLGDFDKDNFICIGCFSKAEPVSYRPGNLVRAYFRVKIHEENCDIHKYKELIRKGKKQRVSTSSGFPLPYPSKLYLQDKVKKVINDEDINSIAAKKVKIYTQNKEKKEFNQCHQTTSSTIRPIVEHYLNFPFDRDVKLNIPFLDTRLITYRDNFQRIDKYNKTIDKFKNDYRETKLYYIPLSVESNNIIRNDEILMLKLLCGDNDEDFYLKIDISTWRDKQKSDVVYELNEKTKKKKALYSQNKKSKDNVYLFFIGQLNKHNPYEFELIKNDFRLYYEIFTKIIYPKRINKQKAYYSKRVK